MTNLLKLFSETVGLGVKGVDMLLFRSDICFLFSTSPSIFVEKKKKEFHQDFPPPRNEEKKRLQLIPS